MSSEGTGSPISVDEAIDLLQKFSTESTRVQVIFTGSVAGIRSAVIGVVRRSFDDSIWVMEDPDAVGSSFVGFDPSVSILRRYGDDRSMLDRGGPPSGFRFKSMLTFGFRDGSTISLFEFADTTDGSEE
jgi:hypothetical protein